MYVIKTNYEAFIQPHSNGKELNLCITSIEDAHKFTLTEAKEIERKFPDRWDSLGCEIFEVTQCLKKVE